MLFSKYLSDAENKTKETIFLRWLSAWMGVVILVLLYLISGMSANQRVVIVPPEIEKSFWVSGKKVSNEYLEQMAYWFSGLALNITPHVANYQLGLFVKYAAPGEQGRLKTEIDDRINFIKKNSISTLFSVKEILIDEKNLRVALFGTLTTFVADKKTSDRSTVYVVAFKYLNGRLYVSDFKETSNDNPFGILASGGNK